MIGGSLAGDVSIDEPEKAAVCEAILADIFSNKAGTEEEIEIAKKLGSIDTSLLLIAPTKRTFAPNEDQRRHFEDLEALGLVRGLDRRQAVKLSIAWIVGTCIGLVLLYGVILKYYPRQLTTEAWLATGGMSLALAALGLALLSLKYRLTKLGRSLRNSIMRFYKLTSRGARFLSFNIVPGQPIAWAMIAALLVCSIPFVPLSYFSVPPRIIVTRNPPVPTPQGPPQQSAPPATVLGGLPNTEQLEELTQQDVATKIDIWRSVIDQMNNLVGLTNQGIGIFNSWPQNVKTDRNNALNNATQLNNSFQQTKAALESLRTAYSKYPDVGYALAEVVSSGRPKPSVFDRLYRSLDSFGQAIRALPSPLPENYENIIRPYSGELKQALDGMANWATTTRDVATNNSQDLLRIGTK